MQQSHGEQQRSESGEYDSGFSRAWQVSFLSSLLEKPRQTCKSQKLSGTADQIMHTDQ